MRPRCSSPWTKNFNMGYCRILSTICSSPGSSRPFGFSVMSSSHETWRSVNYSIKLECTVLKIGNILFLIFRKITLYPDPLNIRIFGEYRMKSNCILRFLNNFYKFYERKTNILEIVIFLCFYFCVWDFIFITECKVIRVS